MFHLFPALPIELRLVIWSFSRSSRVISLIRDIEFEEEHPGRHRCKARASWPCPAILLACHESRSLALQFYRPTFHLQLPQPIYFDYTLDSLYMLDLYTPESFFKATLELYRLRKQSDSNTVQLPEKALRIVTRFDPSTTNELSERLLMRGFIHLDQIFPSLRELIVVGYRTKFLTESEFKVRIPRIGSYKGSTHQLIGKDQYINGVLLATPGRFVPEIVFWSEEIFTSWITQL